MAGYLPPPSWASGQTVPASDWDTYVRDNIMALASKCMLAYNASFGPGSGFSGKLGLNTEVYDSADNMGDAVTNSRITFKRSGTYRIVGEVGAPVGGGWTVTVMKNGTTTLMSKTEGAGFEALMDSGYAFAVSDFVEIFATTSGPVSAVANLARRPSPTFALLAAEWVGQ